MANRFYFSNPILFLLLLLMAMPVYALECFIVVQRDPAWQDYNVEINMFAGHNRQTQPILSFNFPKLKNITDKADEVKKPFDCQTIQRFHFQVVYTPAIWYSRDGKPIGNKFRSRKLYNIINQYNALEKQPKKSLVIIVNYPKDFPVGATPIK